MFTTYKMTPKRRLLSAIFGGRVDRIPVASATSITTFEQEEMTDAYFPEAHYNAEKMARLAAGGYEILGYDCIYPPFSLVTEAAALGAPINWGDAKNMPVVIKSVWKDPEEVKIPNDFLQKPTTKTLIEAINILRNKYGHKIAILGKVMGPWTLSYHMHGVQETLMDSVTEPDKLREFMMKLKEITIIFGKAQIAAGADILQISDHATGDMTSPETYRDFVLPFHKELSQELGCPMVLHICGNTLDRLKYICESGFDCFHFDSKVNARDAVKEVNGRISLMGNINNPVVLLNGTPEMVAEQTRYAIDAGVQIVGPECAIPIITPNANLLAIAKVANGEI